MTALCIFHKISRQRGSWTALLGQWHGNGRTRAHSPHDCVDPLTPRPALINRQRMSAERLRRFRGGAWNPRTQAAGQPATQTACAARGLCSAAVKLPSVRSSVRAGLRTYGVLCSFLVKRGWL
jgi:hypothetical protein